MSKAAKKETGIVAVGQALPTIVKEESPVRVIMKRIENVKLLHQFINKSLNVALKKRMKRLEKGQVLTDKERTDLEIDYGTIPGSKPFLKQPGAEKILQWAYSRPEYETVVENMGNGHIEVISRVKLKATADGTEVFSGPMCSCSSMESNFRFRWMERDEKPAKEESDRLKKLGVGRFRKEKKWVNNKPVEEWVWQDRIENPNIYDERNNVRQRSEKRALVKAVRQFGALSEIFTTDPNDWDAEARDEESEPETDYEPRGRVVMESEHSEATKAPIDIPSQPESKPDPSQATITIDWRASMTSPLITGDANTFKPLFDAHCTWGNDGFWHTDQKGAVAIETLSKSMRFKLEQIFPPREKAGADRGKAPASAQTKTAPASRKEPPQPAGAAKGESGGAEPVLVSGTIEAIAQKDKRVDVKLSLKKANGASSVWMSAWDSKHFPYLVKGAECELFVVKREKGDKVFVNVVGLKRVNTTEFEDDGKTAILRTDRPAGARTLF